MTDRQRQRLYNAENAVMPDLAGQQLVEFADVPGLTAADAGRRSILSMTDAGRRKVRAARLAAAKDCAALVTSTAWWRELTGLDVPGAKPRSVYSGNRRIDLTMTHVTLGPNRTGSSTGGRFGNFEWRINLSPSLGVRPWIIAHELAHVATYRAIEKGHYADRKITLSGHIEGHGAEYAGVYLAIVGLLLGHGIEATLRDAFAAGRVAVVECPLAIPDVGPGGLFAPAVEELPRAARRIEPVTRADQLPLF